MSMKCIPPNTTLYSKTGVCRPRGIPIFLIFAPWRGHSNMYPQSMTVLTYNVLSNNKKNIQNFLWKFLSFYNFKNNCILQRHVFIILRLLHLLISPVRIYSTVCK